MQNGMSNRIKEYTDANAKKKIWQKIVIILSCIVVFCTTYALILPAITMTEKPICGHEEHIHNKSCYSKITVPGKLNCSFSLHHHTEQCYSGKKLVCGYADYVLHEHDKNCYDNEGKLVCKLTEVAEHEHNDDCFEKEIKYVCGFEENKGHKHDEDCYDKDKNLICNLEEAENHIHTDSCKEIVEKIICGKEDKTFHKHSDSCCVNGVLVCKKTELLRHQHDSGCFAESKTEEVLVCTKEEHKHDPFLCYPQTEENESQPDEVTVSETAESLTEENNESTERFSGNDNSQSTESSVNDENSLDSKTTIFDENSHADEPSTLASDKNIAETTGQAETTQKTNEDQTDEPDTTEKPEELSSTESNQATRENESETLQNAEEPSMPIESFDISEGPVFHISAKTKASKMRSSKAHSVLRTAANDINIKNYVENNGGSFDIKILNPDNTEPEKDADGNYVVVAGQEYKLSLGINAPNGIVPGTYYYNLPQGLTVNAGNGSFVVGGVDIGSWAVDENGRVTMVFNDNANRYTDVVISAMMGVSFSEEMNLIDFDGIISVIVKKPDEGETYTVGKYSDEIIKNAWDNKEHVHWIVHIGSDADTSLVGKTISDSLWEKYWNNHKYGLYDKTIGVHFKATSPDGIEYEWYAYGGGDGLTWGDDEHSWSYVIPETIATTDGQIVRLGEGWSYILDYTTTVTDSVYAGMAIYRNTARIGDVSADGWASQNRGGVVGSLVKEGILNNRTIHWTINQSLSGHRDGEKYAIWYFWDYMLMFDNEDNLKENDGKLIPANPWVPGSAPFNVPENMKVTVTRNGETYTAVNALENRPSGTEPQYGYKAIPAGDKMGWHFYICLPCKCDENPDLCFEKDEATGLKCGSLDENGWCYCWRENEDVSVTITYDTDATEAIENYGGIGDYLKNTMEMYRSNQSVTNASADVVLPGVFKKKLKSDPDKFNGYIASYTITANEAFMDLSGMNQLSIVDTMTETLVYIPGTMVITAENKNGDVRTLEYGTDYSLEYIADEHKIHIVVFEPQTEKYMLYYDAQIVIPKGATSANYSNSATIELFGKTISSETEEKIVADINIVAKSYEITLHKIDSATQNALPGAEFELCMSNGEVIAKGTTDTDGNLVFKTDVTAGVILREHKGYYIMESKAPEGFKVDENKHWVVFCDSNNGCEKCLAFSETYPGIVRIPASKGVTIEMENAAFSYELPATGSVGTLWYTIGGLLLTAGSLLFGCGLRRKKERRYC